MTYLVNEKIYNINMLRQLSTVKATYSLLFNDSKCTAIECNTHKVSTMNLQKVTYVYQFNMKQNTAGKFCSQCC